MAEHFLTKSRLDPSRCIRVGGDPAIESHAALQQVLASKAGADTAKLFAEPLISKGNDQAASTISWYSDRLGQGVPMSKLDPAAEAEFKSVLSRRLGLLKPLIDDPDVGPLVSAALHLGSTSDIWSLDGQPVLTNWGLLPEGAATDEKTRSEHYQRILGRFLPLASAPPISDAERTQWREMRQSEDAARKDSEIAAPVAGAAAGTAAIATTTAAAATSDTADIISPPPERKPRGRVPLLAWVPLLLLLLIFGGVLAWLLVPGNRIFAQDGVEPAITDEAGLATARQVNRDLEERLARLRSSLSGAVCRADGTLLMPDGVTIEGLLPPNLSDPEDRGGRIVDANAKPILPPNPDRVIVDQSDGDMATDTATLLKLLDDRTAMVIASTQQGMGIGTGFFVGPDLLVTNYHVIEGARPENIFVTNHAIGGLKQVEVLKTFGPMEAVGADFALLRVQGVNQPAFTIRQSAESMRLQAVIAAGYPGDVLNTDREFAALREGNLSAVPELTVTDGMVNTEQDLSGTTRAIVHSAPISTGNSGGPLIDMCGRIVGVNTFVIKGPMRNLNFALASDDLVDFLAGTPVKPIVSATACNPRVARPRPVPDADVNQ